MNCGSPDTFLNIKRKQSFQSADTQLMYSQIFATKLKNLIVFAKQAVALVDLTRQFKLEFCY